MQLEPETRERADYYYNTQAAAMLFQPQVAQTLQNLKMGLLCLIPHQLL